MKEVGRKFISLFWLFPRTRCVSPCKSEAFRDTSVLQVRVLGVECCVLRNKAESKGARRVELGEIRPR